MNDYTKFNILGVDADDVRGVRGFPYKFSHVKIPVS